MADYLKLARETNWGHRWKTVRGGGFECLLCYAESGFMYGSTCPALAAQALERAALERVIAEFEKLLDKSLGELHAQLAELKEAERG